MKTIKQQGSSILSGDYHQEIILAVKYLDHMKKQLIWGFVELLYVLELFLGRARWLPGLLEKFWHVTLSKTKNRHFYFSFLYKLKKQLMTYVNVICSMWCRPYVHVYDVLRSNTMLSFLLYRQSQANWFPLLPVLVLS